VEITRVCVIGGSGFVGSHVAHLLSAQRYLVRVPTRHRERAKSLILLPTVDVIEADVHDETQLAGLVRGMDAVINLAGILHGGRGADSFEQLHVELTRKVIAACQAAGVRRLVHMSALAADAQAPSRYLRSKGAAEDLVRASDLDWSILRPSVIYGRGDKFLNRFAVMLEAMPVLLLPCPQARFQPVFVEDVALACVRGLTERSAFCATYDLCGPTVHTLRELIQIVARVVGRRPPVIGLGRALSYLQACMLELLPMKLMTRDNYRSMKIDSVSSAAFPFGIRPTAIEAIIPGYLGNDAPRARYRSYRDHAGRAAS